MTTAPDASDKAVVIYTDGACRGNPGPGGWGALLRHQGVEKELYGGEPHTTNNRMVTNMNMACYGSVISKNTMATNYAIMSNMSISHE